MCLQATAMSTEMQSITNRMITRRRIAEESKIKAELIHFYYSKLRFINRLTIELEKEQENE